MNSKVVVYVLLLLGLGQSCSESYKSALSSLAAKDVGGIGGSNSGGSSGGNNTGGSSGGTTGGQYKLEHQATLKLSNSGHPSGNANDIWGWTDPVTNKEYALLGLVNKTSFVDVSDPKNPIHVGDLVSHNGTTSNWRDIKVYENYAMVVSEASGHGMQIFDLTKLRGLTGSPVTIFGSGDYIHYNKFGNAHNIIINEESGFAYVVGSRQGTHCDSSLHMIDVRSPESPTFAGCAAIVHLGFLDSTDDPEKPPREKCFTEEVDGKTPHQQESEIVQEDGTVIQKFHDEADACGAYYTHDAQCVIYKGSDLEHVGKEICALSNGKDSRDNTNDFHFVDVTDKAHPKLLSTWIIPERAGYAHQGWFTEDFNFFIANDELDEQTYGLNTRTLVVDVRDLDNPKLHMYFYHDSKSIDHNLYIKGNRVYHSNYNSGVMIYDISNLANKEYKFLAQYDTNPTRNSAVFEGSWSNYPYFKSGTIIASHIEAGSLIVLKESK